VKLITRNDASLAVALIATAVIIFQRPLRYALDMAEEVESLYHVDLIPALTLLLCVFVYHETRKWQVTKAAARAAAAEAAQAHMRSEDLQRLMILGQALANALDPSALQQVLWRHLPTFTREHEYWVVLRRDEHWEPFVQDDANSKRNPIEELEALASRALTHLRSSAPELDGTVEADTVCYPLVTAGTASGVLGVRGASTLSSNDREGLGAAAAFLAIAVRNVRIIQATQETSVRDNLTGCFNRAHALETLDSELRRACRSGLPLSVVMFDIDHFKQVNDQLGHLRGDELLRAVGAQLTKVLRSTDVRCRYGGDEFLLILPDTPALGAQQVAEGLRREIATLSANNGEQAVAVSASLGVAVARPKELDAAALIDRADAALYLAKRRGRNRICTDAESALEPAAKPIDIASRSRVLAR
jgi:diguanylate cyclase (GGDEF)-like protein